MISFKKKYNSRFCSLGLARYQLLPSAYVAIELISGLSSSIGMILAIPVTAFIGARVYGRGK